MSGARRSLVVALVAVLGIAVAAAITWGTSQLVRQRIGLASEPLTAGRRLLPSTTSTRSQTARRTTPAPTSATSTPSRTQPAQTSTAPAVESPSSSSPSRTSTTEAPSANASQPTAEERQSSGSGSRDGGGDASSRPRRDD